MSAIEVADMPMGRPLMRAAPGYAAGARADEPAAHDIWIRGDIDPMWGVDVDMIIADLQAIDAESIIVHLDSPGGLVFHGIALFNALVEHTARIEVRITGLAASIASVIAQAGDRIIIARTASMMIHDAWGRAEGNEADMVLMGAILGQLSDQIADVYSVRSGLGTVKSWRELMRAETWFTATEAKEAGLVDEVTKLDRREGRAESQWTPIRDRYRYPDRAHAPAPVIPGPRSGSRDEDDPAGTDVDPPATPADDVTPIDVDDVDWADLFTAQPEEMTP